MVKYSHQSFRSKGGNERNGHRRGKLHPGKATGKPVRPALHRLELLSRDRARRDGSCLCALQLQGRVRPGDAENSQRSRGGSVRRRERPRRAQSVGPQSLPPGRAQIQGRRVH